MSIYSAHGSVTMTTKLEARAPGSYFWSSAVMLDTAFSPCVLCLSPSLSLSIAVSVFLSIGVSFLVTIFVAVSSLSLPLLLSLSLCCSMSLALSLLIGLSVDCCLSLSLSLYCSTLVSVVLSLSFSLCLSFHLENQECFLTVLGACATISLGSQKSFSISLRIKVLLELAHFLGCVFVCLN